MLNKTHTKNNIILILILSVLLLSVTQNLYARAFKTETVTLYSEGKVVKQWEAINQGHMDGQCYVFKIKKSIHTLQVRVCGTFSVEENK